MNLLLLLSALLSALTGVGANARAPERAQAVAQASLGRAVTATAPTRLARRPVSAPLTVRDVATVGIAIPFRVYAAPLWIDRRRE